MSFTDKDEALVGAALSGSVSAWEKLVRRYEGRIYNYGLRLTGNASDAMDLMQEVFLGVYRSLHRFRGDSQFSSWIFRIAHNKAVDLNRRKQLMRGQSSSYENEAYRNTESLVDVVGNEPGRFVAQEQQKQQSQMLLEQLPLEQRLVVELKIFQSMTFDEIAQAQEISENTAKTRFYTALRKLKTVLEESHVMS